MKKELAYFNIEGEYGGNQNWFYDPMMRLGGCAAIATCDLCIYLNLYRENKHLYPFNIDSFGAKNSPLIPTGLSINSIFLAFNPDIDLRNSIVWIVSLLSVASILLLGL